MKVMYCNLSKQTTYVEENCRLDRDTRRIVNWLDHIKESF